MFDKISVLGRLGRDPEMRYLPSGDPVTTFSIAVDRTWKDKSGERQKTTMWMRVEAWGPVAEVIQKHFSKGDPIYVEGELVIDPKTGGPKTFQRQDGSTGTAFEMRMREFKFVPSSNKNRETPQTDAGTPDAEQEDIPF